MTEQWTPLSKKKPPYDKKVLFYTESGEQVVGSRGNSWGQDEYRRIGFGSGYVLCPTHWMNLPKPPTDS